MEFIIFLIQAYTYMVLAAVILSWLNLGEQNPIARLLGMFVDPPLTVIRRFLPATGGVDFSPMVLIFLLYGLRQILTRTTSL